MTLTELSLPPDLELFIRDQIASGAYASEDEVVRAGIAELQRNREAVEEKREYVRSLIQPALEELDRGEGRPLDMEAVKRDVLGIAARGS